MQDDLTHQAAHDSLTGLANRAQAMQLIRGALSRGQRSQESIGLLFVDLDGFKRINDDLGHAAGDEVLRAVAKLMQSEVRGGDTVARLGGDEFVVLLEPLGGQADAVRVADRLVAAVSQPVVLAGGRVVRVGASVGVALSQPGLIDPEALLHEADVAVYRAKSTGRGHTEVFDLDLRRELDQRQRLEAAIATAIEHDELVVHYQPIVQVAHGGRRGLRGAGALEPAGLRPADAGGLHPRGRAVRPDLCRRHLGAAPGHAATGHLECPVGPAGADRGRQHLRTSYRPVPHPARRHRTPWPRPASMPISSSWRSPRPP